MKSKFFSAPLAIMAASCFALAIAGPSVAQTYDELDKDSSVGIRECNAKLIAGEIKTKVDLTICSNEAMTRVYQGGHFPYMDTLYEFEAAALDIASRIDHQQISQDDARTELAKAMLQMKVEIARRAEHAQQVRADQAAASQRAEYQAQQAQFAEQQAAQDRRRALILQYLQNNRTYQLPMPQAQAPQNQTNCITSYIGNQAYTNCH